MLIVLTIIGVWVSIIPAIIRTSTADLCNQTDPFNFTRLDEGESNMNNCGVAADIGLNTTNTDSGCAELTSESVILYEAPCDTRCQFNNTSDFSMCNMQYVWKRARIFIPLITCTRFKNSYDTTTLLNIINYYQQLRCNCTSIKRLYYVDANGIMITYPYYNDTNSMTDQCMDKKILYDPRIKPWYVSTITVPKVLLLIIHSTNSNMTLRSLMKLTSLLLVETLSESDHIMVHVGNVHCTDGIVAANSSQQFIVKNCIVNNLNFTRSMDICMCKLYQKFYRMIDMESIHKRKLIMLLVDYNYYSIIVTKCNDTLYPTKIFYFGPANAAKSNDDITTYIVNSNETVVEAVMNYYKPDFINNDTTTETVSKDDIFSSDCMCHQTICSKLNNSANTTTVGVICIDYMHKNNSADDCERREMTRNLSVPNNSMIQCNSSVITSHTVNSLVIICLCAAAAMLTAVTLCCILLYRRKKKRSPYQLMVRFLGCQRHVSRALQLNLESTSIVSVITDDDDDDDDSEIQLFPL